MHAVSQTNTAYLHTRSNRLETPNTPRLIIFYRTGAAGWFSDVPAFRTSTPALFMSRTAQECTHILDLQRAPCASHLSNIPVQLILPLCPILSFLHWRPPHARYPRAIMRLPLFGPLFMSLAFDQALAAPSSSDWIHRQQGNSKLQNGHLFRRDNGTVSLYSSTSSIRATTVASASFVTLVAPSPGASAISIISQGQIITSYAPLTVCPKTAPSSRPTAVSPYSPAVPALMPSAHVVSPALFNTTAQVARRRVPALYGNATNTPVPSVPHAPLPSCSVTYIPSTTPICHTTLTPLGGLPVPISACDQNITFSTDHGMASTAGSAELLATYYVVPWQDAAGGVPTGIVDAEICNPASQCSTVQERWRISTVTVTKTQTNTLSVNTVVTGVSDIFSPAGD